jgi:4-hydroxybenzoate polyprenyltransferase
MFLPTPQHTKSTPAPRGPVVAEKEQQVEPSSFRAVMDSLRMHQWVKNSLLFAGIVFSGQLTNLISLLTACVAFAVFCLVSSGVYLLNDLADREADRKHPVKRHRPLASGRLSPRTAAAACLLLLAFGVGGGFAIGYAFGCLVCVYVGQNLAYSMALKRVAILDIMMVAGGFVIRAVAGAVAISSTASPWLVICSLMLALFVACGKRRHELNLLQNHAADHRENLTEYTPELLDLMMAITGCAGVMTYVLYALSPWAYARNGSFALALTVPTVLYGVFRFLYLVHHKEAGGEPSRLFVMDKGLLFNGVLWLAVTCFAVYAPAEWLPWWWIEL